jgi:hypothetical protein
MRTYQAYSVRGPLVMESILETEAATILQFFAGLRGTLSVTFEEGTWSAWLYDLLNPRVDRLVVCNPLRAITNFLQKRNAIPARARDPARSQLVAL